MDRLSRLGRIIFLIGVAALGLQHLIIGNFGPGLESVPGWVVGRTLLAYLVGLTLLGGAGMVLLRIRTQAGALAVAVTFSVLLAFLQWPLLLYHFTDPNVWTTVFETLALSGAAWMLVASIAAPGEKQVSPKIGRLAFGIALPAFGVLHFMYLHFVSTLIPAWMPDRVFLAGFVGVCFIAAGAAIITGIRARLAGALLGLMFAIFVATLHIPLVITHFHNGSQWTSLCVAVMMWGGGWMASGADGRTGA
ncbi:MAG: hypothetical protein ACREL4_01245 [Gemmatimonadales bacterium]